MRSGDHGRETGRREGSRRVQERTAQKPCGNTHRGNSWALCLCKLSWSHWQRTSPLWEPPGPTHAATSSNKAWDPALSPASSHILTFSGVSLFAFCLRRSALMNAEVKGLRKNNGDTSVIKETNGQVYPREEALVFLRITGISDLLQIFQGDGGSTHHLDKAWGSPMSLTGGSHR